MKVFAVSDLHLPGGQEKPMNIFGPQWEGHFDKIRRDWLERVGDEDLVLLPGDLSWAMRLGEALEDLRLVGSLPGKKVLLRGNHDLWWSGINSLRQSLPENMYAVQNDALVINGTIICGSRGWTPITADSSKDDRRIYEREIQRMKLSLECAARLQGSRMIIMMHYPPLNEKHEPSPFSAMAESVAPCDLIYGHLHGSSYKGGFRGIRNRVRYTCVSCDGLGFRLADLTDPLPDEIG